MNKQELLENLRAGRSRLDAELAQVPRSEMDRPALENGWSIKDMLAHIGYWEARAAEIFQTLVNGKPLEQTYNDAIVDEINARVFAEHHDRPLDEVLAWERQCYLDLLAMTESASEMDLFDPHRFGWTRGTPYAEWILGNSYEHYDEHLLAVQKWRRSQEA